MTTEQVDDLRALGEAFLTQNWLLVGEQIIQAADALHSLRGNLSLAIATIENLADQQAMADPWYEPSLEQFRAALDLP